MGFLPPDFEVPALLEHDRFRLRPITVDDVVKDYDAVMSSREHLWRQFGEAWAWPPADLTLEQDRQDLAWPGTRRVSAALLVRLRGDVQGRGAAARLRLCRPGGDGGLRRRGLAVGPASELATGLEAELDATVRRWVEERWPFDKVAYPGRGP